MDNFHEYLLSVGHTSLMCTGPPIIPQKTQRKPWLCSDSFENRFYYIILV